jgi:hypothetical protein
MVLRKSNSVCVWVKKKHTALKTVRFALPEIGRHQCQLTGYPVVLVRSLQSWTGTSAYVPGERCLPPE